VKTPALRFKDRPARKAAQLRRFAGKLDQAGLDVMLKAFPTDAHRNIALEMLRPHLKFEPKLA
jgi:hypothetical protein